MTKSQLLEALGGLLIAAALWMWQPILALVFMGGCLIVAALALEGKE